MFSCPKCKSECTADHKADGSVLVTCPRCSAGSSLAAAPPAAGTPGPWAYRRSPFGHLVTAATDTFARTDVLLIPATREDDARGEADARLCAAAPALRDALRAVAARLAPLRAAGVGQALTLGRAEVEAVFAAVAAADGGAR